MGELFTIHRLYDEGIVDLLTASDYEDESVYLRNALEGGGVEVHHIPTMAASKMFPENIEELSRYDVVILSDVGRDTLLLHPEVLFKSRPRPNRLGLLREYVVNHGKGFLMIGGYLSFQGFRGSGGYKGSPVEEILPVGLMDYDDRVEVPEGFSPKVADKYHPISRDLPDTWPTLLGYNKTSLKNGASLIAEFNNDPILAAWQIGKGRTAAFTSDCAPHWCTPVFINWIYYPILWRRIVGWLAWKT